MRSIALEQTTLGISQTSAPAAAGRGRLWTGRLLSGLAVLFLTFDGLMKVLMVAPVVKATHELGFPIGAVFKVGVLLLACLAVYLVPRTAILGAILLTGFLGGAVATNVHTSQPLFTHVLFPVYVAALVWGGLYLRDGRVRAVLGRPTR